MTLVKFQVLSEARHLLFTHGIHKAFFTLPIRLLFSLVVNYFYMLSFGLTAPSFFYTLQFKTVYISNYVDCVMCIKDPCSCHL